MAYNRAYRAIMVATGLMNSSCFSLVHIMTGVGISKSKGPSRHKLELN